MGVAVSGGNAAAFEKLQAAIDMMAKVGRLPEQVAAACVEPLRRETLANIAANRDPNHRPWPVSLSGGPVLLNAGKSLEVGNTGPTLWARLYGVEARHHLGAVKGGVRRRIIPRRDSMRGVAKIFTRVSKQKWKEATSG